MTFFTHYDCFLMILNLASASEASCFHFLRGGRYYVQGEGRQSAWQMWGVGLSFCTVPREGQFRMTLLFLTLDCRLCRHPDDVRALPVLGATNSLAALKLYFYHNYTYRFLFQFSIYSFCLVQFHAVYFLFCFSGYYDCFFFFKSVYSIL